jgi:phosphohistidine phosphatase SixA
VKLDFSPPARRTLKVHQPYTGTGKSYAAAGYLAEVAAYPVQDNGQPLLKVTYAAPSHRVASDMERALAERGVPSETVVHRWSVLMAREDLDGTVTPSCQRAEEIQILIEAGTGLQPRKVCISCPFRQECPAHAAALRDDVRAKTAAIEIVTHAALGGDAAEQPLICDEPPGYLDDVSVSSEVLSWIRGDQPLHGVLVHEREVARQIARAWLRGADPYAPAAGYAREDEDGNLVERETIGQWLAHRDGSAFDVVNGHDLPRGASAQTLATIRGVRDVLRLAAWDLRRGHPRRKGTKAVDVSIPAAAIMRLREQGGILLDGTPWLTALTELFDTLEVFPAEEPNWASLPVTRQWRESNGVAKVRLCHSYWDGARFNDEPGCRRVDDVSVPGVNWPLVLNELRRALSEVSGTVLLGSFKLVVDVLSGKIKDHVERDGALAPLEKVRLSALEACRRLVTERGVQSCSFGAVRSRNDWQDVQAVLVVGSPFMSAQRTAEALGIDESDVEAARCEYAQGELIQTAERGRSVRRTEANPLTLTIVCASKCLPKGWGVKTRRTLPTTADERRQDAALALHVAISVHGEDGVKAALVPNHGDRSWRKWMGGEVDLSSVDGLLAELCKGEQKTPIPREYLRETQNEWRRLLGEVSAAESQGAYRKQLNKYVGRGRLWLIPLCLGQYLESL